MNALLQLEGAGMAIQNENFSPDEWKSSPSSRFLSFHPKDTYSIVCKQNTNTRNVYHLLDAASVLSDDFSLKGGNERLFNQMMSIIEAAKSLAKECVEATDAIV